MNEIYLTSNPAAFLKKKHNETNKQKTKNNQTEQNKQGNKNKTTLIQTCAMWGCYMLSHIHMKLKKHKVQQPHGSNANKNYQKVNERPFNNMLFDLCQFLHHLQRE